MIENVSMLNDIGSFGSYDNNHYARPLDDNGIITTNVLLEGGYKSSFYNLAGWATKYGYDQHSNKSPIKIPAYTVNNLIGANRYANESFDNNVDGIFINSSPGKGTASFNSGGKLDGGALQVSFDSTGGASNDVGAYIDFGAVTAGKTYLINFSLLSAASGKTIKASFMQNGGAYSRLSDTRYLELTTTRAENQLLFTAPTSETNVMIALELNGKDCPFWLDNFQVFEANVTMTNPDDYIRFDYNTTGLPKKIAINGTYIDAKNISHSGTVTIDPFSSVVLMKQASSSAATQAATQRVTSQITETKTAEMKTKEALAMTVKVSPNPASEKLQVEVNLPAGTQAASMSIYSLAGVKLKTIPLSTSASIIPVDVSTFSNGVYIINIVYDGHIITKKFVKQL